jgi:hypothetical protein
MAIDLNKAGEQRSRDVIPENVTLILQMSINGGGVGEGGWMKRASDGNSIGLDCEFKVIGPAEYAGRKVYQRFTMEGTTDGHKQAGEISIRTLRAIWESVHGIRFDDHSPEAEQKRIVPDWDAFDGARFLAKLGIQPANGRYAAKNFINEIITPEMREWKAIDQIQVERANRGAPTSTTPTAAVSRPQWAK